MVFSSTSFLFLFFPCLLFFYYFPFFKNSRTWKNSVLLIFSLAFYAWGEPLFVFLMIFSAFFNWWIALQMERTLSKKRFWMISGITFDLLLLGIFKYVSFISKNLAALFENNSIILNIALPIGISFFTFQLMSYVLDVYYGYSSTQRNPFYILLYVSLFPQLIAGPIVRYQQIEDEITTRHETLLDFTSGMHRFIYGLSKKTLLANFLAQIADNVFDYQIYSPTVAIAWIGAIAYSLQIYFDFSAYSDMAIGLGQMFGFHFLENFNYPYIASSVTDFWRRWHISLSTWFRDYVYIPLGGNRVSKQRLVFNLFIVWSLTGIWHGANWTFIFWGLMYFVVLLTEKITNFPQKLGLFKHCYTLIIVLIAWVFFRSPDIASGFRYTGYLFGIGVSKFYDPAVLFTLSGTYFVLIISLIGTTPFLKNVFKSLESTHLSWLESGWLFLLFIVSLTQVVSSTYNPFIYFNF